MVDPALVRKCRERKGPVRGSEAERQDGQQESWGKAESGRMEERHELALTEAVERRSWRGHGPVTVGGGQGYMTSRGQ